jgi:hypothetical protein
MKYAALAILLGTIFAIMTGCASPPRGAAYGREQELRAQLADSIPVREYGYVIQELRFSPDYKKVLVVFTHPGKQETNDNTTRRPNWEFVLTADEFERYRGSNIQPFYTPGTANTPSVFITVTLPAK